MFRILDLFSGIGGFALGLERAGMRTVAFCETDPFCRRVLAHHWPDVPIHGDIRQLDGARVIADVGPIDVICGGFPCQPWSLAGKRAGHDDDRHLWPEMHRLVGEVRPQWVIGENVPGLDDERFMALDGVLADLEAIGYQAWTVEIPACAVGAPHIRNRIWILAHAKPAEIRRSTDGTQGPLRAAKRGEGALVARSSGEDSDVAHADGAESSDWHGEPNGQAAADAERLCRDGRLGDTECAAVRVPRCGSDAGAAGGAEDGEEERQRLRHDDRATGGMGDARLPEPSGRDEGACGSEGRTCNEPAPSSGSQWDSAEWLACPDGKARRVGSGLRLLADGVPERVAKLRALGNAAVPQVVEQIGRAIVSAEIG